MEFQFGDKSAPSLECCDSVIFCHIPKRHKFLQDLHKLTYTMIANLLQISSLILGLGKLLLNCDLKLVSVRLKLSMSKLMLGTRCGFDPHLTPGLS